MKQPNSPINNLDLTEICERYCKERMLRTASADSYRRCIGVFIGDTGVRTVDAITSEILFEWRDQVVLRCKPASFNTYYTHLRAIVNYCLRKRYIAESPLLGTRWSRRAPRRRKACSQEEVNRLCQYLLSCTDLPWSRFALNMVLTFYYSGIRRAQLCGLEWRDIDFGQRIIHLHSEHSKTGEAWKIPLHQDLHDILLRMKEDAKRRFPDFRNSDQVFLIQRYSPLHKGSRMTPDQLSKIMQKSAKRCGVYVSAHRMRHLFATILANQETRSGEAPLTLVALKDILGHRSITTTVGYIEPRLETQREVMKGIKGLSVVECMV